ncbi:alpha/beta fold hydrolase [Parasediminibacterium sp. JCM 36343]|uniref:alpha/beta fold hydrolase n=1 Tax=Parasediminibacterium sp. JCM 36343 TaxID=3374279 RepID=UPI003979AB54
MFCFHGYGLDGSSFAFLEPVLGHEYTLICIDLPFHGSTIWQEGLLMATEDLLDIMQQVHPCQGKAFSLLGYSMGGRVALHVLQAVPAQIKKVVLIAPDGLRHNFWQQLATQYAAGRRLFHYTMLHPNWLFGLINFAARIKLLNKSIAKFAQNHINNPEERKALYKRWLTMRDFSTNTHLLKQLIERYKIPVNMLFGQFDRVIPSKAGLAFKGTSNLTTIKEIPAGHQLLKEQYAADIAGLFS